MPGKFVINLSQICNTRGIVNTLYCYGFIRFVKGEKMKSITKAGVKEANPSYLEMAQKLSILEQERVLSRMGGKLPKRLQKEKLTKQEAIAIQLELEDEQLQEWRTIMAELKAKTQKAQMKAAEKAAEQQEKLAKKIATEQAKVAKKEAVAQQKLAKKSTVKKTAVKKPVIAKPSVKPDAQVETVNKNVIKKV
jgi:hypothetical protein